jgi:hypothetical protein
LALIIYAEVFSMFVKYGKAFVLGVVDPLNGNRSKGDSTDETDVKCDADADATNCGINSTNVKVVNHLPDGNVKPRSE